MRKIIAFGLLIVLYLFAYCLHGPVYAGEINFSDLLQKIKEAGKKTEFALHDIQVSQVSELIDAALTTKIETVVYKKGGMFKLVSNSNATANKGAAKREVVLFDGKDLWTIAGGVKKKYAPTEIEKLKLLLQKNWWDLVPANANCVQTLKNGIVENYIIKFQNPDDQKTELNFFVGAKEYNLKQIIGKLFDGKIMIVNFDDWRVIAKNCSIPFKIDTFLEGKLVGKTVIQTVSVNSGIPDSVFNEKSEKAFDVKEILNEMFN